MPKKEQLLNVLGLPLSFLNDNNNNNNNTTITQGIISTLQEIGIDYNNVWFMLLDNAIHVQDISKSEANFSEYLLPRMLNLVGSEFSKVSNQVTGLIKCTQNLFRHAPYKKCKWREYLLENGGIPKNPPQYADTRWSSQFET